MGNAAGLSIDWEDVMAASRTAMAVVDTDQYVSVNGEFTDLYDIPPEEDLSGEPWVEQFTLDEPERFKRQVLSRCRDDGEWRGPVLGRRADGSTFSQSLCVTPLSDGLFALSVEDAERREGEDDTYETIVETVADGVYVLDENLQFSFVNDRLCEMTEIPKDRLVGEPVTALFEYDDELAKAEAIRQRTREGETNVGTVRASLPTSNGERVLEARYTLQTGPEGEFRESVGVVRDITDRRESEGELRRARRFNEELVENAPFGMFRLDDELRIVYENPRAEQIIGLPDEEESSEAIGVDIRELPSIRETGEARLFTRLKEGETIEFEFPFESIYGKEAYFTGRGVPLYRDGEFDGAILMATDISERRRHEQELERQRDELETLNQINELLFEILVELFDSPTRAEIERIVCDRLASSELYRFAWIGETGPDGERIIPRNSAGIDDGYVDSITVSSSNTETGNGPGGCALRTGEVQVSQDVRSDPAFEPWRQEAVDRGIRSAAAVPLTSGESTYGILAVYASRPLGFSRREQAGFDTLGKAIGFAMNAIENRKLLFADTVVELEFEVTDSKLVFVRLSEQLECDLTITGYVESESGRWSVYVDVDGAEPERVRELATDDSTVDYVRTIATDGTAGVVEFVMVAPALNGLSEYGALLTSGSIDDGRGRFCIEVPQTADVRRLVDRLLAIYPASTLVAQREHDRPVQTASEVRESIADRLTERRREALARAYHAGYFEWPRQSTAAEIATSMDIAETTFHYHLRNALQTLSATFLNIDRR